MERGKSGLGIDYSKITDKTLDVVVSRFLGFSFIITLRQKPKGVTSMPFFCRLVIQIIGLV